MTYKRRPYTGPGDAARCTRPPREQAALPVGHYTVRACVRGSGEEPAAHSRRRWLGNVAAAAIIALVAVGGTLQANALPTNAPFCSAEAVQQPTATDREIAMAEPGLPGADVAPPVMCITEAHLPVAPPAAAP